MSEGNRDRCEINYPAFMPAFVRTILNTREEDLQALDSLVSNPSVL